jgi:NAD-dependent dihydropyrimidine dehydrogenase PreA subunit
VSAGLGALSTDDVAHVNWGTCMGCGACESQCPEECIELVRDEAKGMPLDVRLLA